MLTAARRTPSWGAAYWLIHHLNHPDHAAPLSASPASVARQANGRVSAVRVVNLTLHNESAWLDLSPVLRADIQDPDHAWTVGFRLGGKDITQAVVQKGGFVFVQDQRLWPKASKQLQIVLTCKNPAKAQPVTVQLALLANPTRRDKLNQTLTIHDSMAAQTKILASTTGVPRL